MPFPSTGCRTCKIRRIKCDEGRPVCQRCTKANRTCSPVDPGPIVHLENQYANGQIKRPRGPRWVGTATCSRTTLARNPSIGIETPAVVYYLQNHIRISQDTPSVLKGVADSLTPLWTSSPNHPLTIDLAIATMSLAVFSRKEKCPTVAIEASIKYNQLLRNVQSAVTSLNQRNIDACLLAIFFMGRYENIIHQPKDNFNAKTPFATSLRGFSHNDGALALLKVWKNCLSHSQPATDVVRYTRRCLIKSALLRNLHIPNWMTDGSEFGEHGLELDYYRINVDVANIRHQLSVLLKLSNSENLPTNDLKLAADILNDKLHNVDSELETWATNFHTAWTHQTHKVANAPSKEFFSSIVYSYLRLEDAAMWLQYSSTRILLQATCLELLDLLRTDPESSQRSECLLTFNKISDDIAASLPFCLERFHMNLKDDTIALDYKNTLKPAIADLLVWPLSILSSLKHLSLVKRAWFRMQLADLGRVIGDRVLEFDDATRWLQV